MTSLLASLETGIELALSEPDPVAAGRALHEVMAAATLPRAKPLTARTLAALPVGLKVWDDQITYIREALADDKRDGYRLHLKVRSQFAAQLTELERARDWLAAKIAAEGGAS